MPKDAQRIVLASRPEGAVTLGNFRLENFELPEPGDGEVAVRVTHFSLDPYMRGRMDAAKSYSAPIEVGALMDGAGVGVVIASKARGLDEGDLVTGDMGWASHAVRPGKALIKLDPALPPTAALGVLGMPGFTGWHGLNAYGQPKPGETLVVAAATGPVGSMVGQLAKKYGLRTVGIAGGPEKCRLATETFGFDTCLDHRAYRDGPEMRAAIAAAAPDGVDIYFENVAGKVLEGVLPLMNVGGRIPLCGMVAYYDLDAPPGGPDQLPRLWRTLLVRRLAVRGFIISDHWDRFPTFLGEVAPLVADGTVKYLEDIAEGLENAPSAFMAMLKGGNRGKQIVKVSE